MIDYFVTYFPCSVKEYNSYDDNTQDFLMLNFIGSLKDKYCTVTDEEWEEIEREYYSGVYETLRKSVITSDEKQGVEDFKNYIEALTFEFLLT